MKLIRRGGNDIPRARIIEVREPERQRIADELHDQVAQLLFAARLSLDFALEIPGLPEGAAANDAWIDAGIDAGIDDCV